MREHDYAHRESPIVTKLWPDYWSEDERGEFAAWLAQFPEAGDVVPGSGGIRMVRWARSGQGKEVEFGS